MWAATVEKATESYNSHTLILRIIWGLLGGPNIMWWGDYKNIKIACLTPNIPNMTTLITAMSTLFLFGRGGS